MRVPSAMRPDTSLRKIGTSRTSPNQCVSLAKLRNLPKWARLPRPSAFARRDETCPAFQCFPTFWNLFTDIVDRFHALQRVIQGQFGNLSGYAHVAHVSLCRATGVVRREFSDLNVTALECT